MTGSTASGTGDRGSPWPDVDPGATGDTIAQECPWCRTAEQADGRTCLNCGRTLGAPSSSTSSTPQPAVASDPPAQAASWPPPPPPPPPVPRLAVTVDPTVVALRRRALQERARTEVGPARPWVVLVWLAMAAVGIAILAISFNFRDSDQGAPPDATLPAIAPTSPVATAAPLPPVAAPVLESTTMPVSSPTTAPTPTPTTIPATSTPVTTAPVTTVTSPDDQAPVEPDPAPGTPLPSVPASPPRSGPGSPQVLNDPLPSGAGAQSVAPAFAVAQRLADAFANGQWDTVRGIDLDAQDSSDQAFETGYGGLDRASLMLLDAVLVDDGYRLLVVSVANELGGARTSLYCLEWTVDPEAGTVDQHADTVGLLARVSEVISPEAVRNDPALDDTLRSNCHWRSADR